MNKGLAILLIVVLAIALFVGGMFFGQSRWSMIGFQTNPLTGPNFGMMGNSPGMMNNGSGMMGNGMMGSGMMGGSMMGNGMMGGMMNGSPTLTGVDPLSLEEVETAVTNYLSNFNNDDLIAGEIMIFNNHAYAEVIEKSTGEGAFEVLVNPATLTVSPEPGPNMMWKTQYSTVSGMMGGMMNATPVNTGEMSITPDEAIAAAQRYLDNYLPGATANTEADRFPGYYTIHILRDDEVAGMLSVNGYTGWVFLHHWHGDFVEMSEEPEG